LVQRNASGARGLAIPLPGRQLGYIRRHRSRLVSGAAIERVIQEASADDALVDDLAALRGQMVEPLRRR
jgi:hypothetical protein